MSKNHGFVDGNKRTTLLLLHTFVVRSGYSIEPMHGEDLNEAIEDMILDVVTRKITALDAAKWFKARLRRG
jgi:prophage maintenance system killer protein